MNVGARPTVDLGPLPEDEREGGRAKDMTLLDWFAGQALIGLIATYGQRAQDADAAAELAPEAYFIAKAMVREKHDPE